MQKSISYKGNEVCYQRIGNGDLAFVACHGYGERGSVFESLNGLDNRYTILALDLPFHGKTEWEGFYYRPQDLEQVIALILKEEVVSLFGFMGFSMGGRIASRLVLNQSFEPKVLILFAPEGVYRDNWHFVLRVPQALKIIFTKVYVQHSVLFTTATKFLVYCKLLPKSILTFMEVHDQKYSRRKRLMGVWNTFDQFNLSWENLSNVLEREGIKCVAYLGGKDITLNPDRQKAVLSALENTKVCMIDHAHFLLRKPDMVDIVNKDLESMS